MVFDDSLEGSTQHDDENSYGYRQHPEDGPLKWMTAAEAAHTALVETWTLEQLGALAKLGTTTITFGLGAPADGHQWITDDPHAPLVLYGLGVEPVCIWTRTLAVAVIGPQTSPSLSLQELAAAVCLVQGTREPRLPRVLPEQEPPVSSDPMLILGVQAAYAHLLNALAPRLWPDGCADLDADELVLLKERARHLLDVTKQPDPGLAAAAWRAAYAPVVGTQPPAPFTADPGLSTGQYL